MDVCSVKNSNVNFTSKAPEVRDAEKFCRILASEFPVFSGTKASEFYPASTDKFQKNIKINVTVTENIREPFLACNDNTNITDDCGIKMTQQTIDAVSEKYPQFIIKKGKPLIYHD